MNNVNDDPTHIPGYKLAVAAELLYLANLLLLPGIAFIMLIYLYIKYHRTASHLALCHLRQTLNASLWAGVLLIVVNFVILLAGGYRSGYTWVIMILYFTICHSTLVMLGIIGLSKAMTGKGYPYPLLRHCGWCETEKH